VNSLTEKIDDFTLEEKPAERPRRRANCCDDGFEFTGNRPHSNGHGCESANLQPRLGTHTTKRLCGLDFQALWMETTQFFEGRKYCAVEESPSKPNGKVHFGFEVTSGR